MIEDPSGLGPHSPARTGEDTRPLGVIVSELWENTEKLARQELELGLAKVDRRVTEVKRDLIAMTIGGAIMYAGILAVMAAIVLLLAKAIDPWLSALIVGVVVSGAGYMLLQRGKKDLVEPDHSTTSNLNHPTLSRRS